MPKRILITGVCGFVGSTLAQAIPEHLSGCEIIGIDNLSRSGSAGNASELASLGVRFIHADVRVPGDLQSLPTCDWVIDAAAHPSVLAGISTQCSPRQVVDNNLIGTTHLLEQCRQWRAGFTLLSSSRVYSIPPLASLPVLETNNAFDLESGFALTGLTERGIGEKFSTAAPVSLYGATKLASEAIALEYGYAFDIPVFVNRCGILAGGTQFGRANQGIFSFWLRSWRARAPLRYTGFGGRGFQVRDCLHPKDLATLVVDQIKAPTSNDRPPIVNVSGGLASARSLAQVSQWCCDRWGNHQVESDPNTRPFDLPWVVLDSAAAEQHWDWNPTMTTEEIFEEIATHAEQHPDWLDQSNLY
ncbi:MAG: NAD-dependent epimerase/dehydratase family protein [Rubripirellula sp.]